MNPYNYDEVLMLSHDRINSALEFVERERIAREFRGAEPEPPGGPLRPLALAGALVVVAIIAAVTNPGLLP